MNVTVAILTLALLPAYVCRLGALDVRQDPWWDSLATYLFFALTVKAGSAVAMDDLMPWHVAATVLALLWIAATYYRWSERSLAGNR